MKRLAMLILLLLTPALCLAADGWQADITEEVIIDPAILEMFGGMMGGAVEGAEGTEAMLDDESLKTTSRIYFSGTMMRTDTTIGDMVSSTLVDMENGVTWTFTNMEQVAYRMDLPDVSEFTGPLGGAMLEPTDMYLHWQELIDEYKNSEEMIVNEFADRTISGYNCKGIGFAIDPEAMDEMLGGLMNEAGPGADPGADAGEALGALMGMLGPILGGGISGEIWVAEGIDIPVLLQLNLGMTSVSSTLDNISDWTPDSAMLSVPGGYTIEEQSFDMPDFMNMPDDSGSQSV